MFDVVSAAAHVTPSVPVTVQGLSWGGLANWALLAVITPLAIGFFKIWPKLRQLNNESDASLRNDLMARIDTLEKQMSEERRECNTRLDAMQRAHEARLDAMQKQHETENAALQGEIKGLRDSIMQTARSGAAVMMHANAPTSEAKFKGTTP